MKFILSFSEYYSFRERLSFYATRDEHGQKNGKYPVFSRYYDTHDMEFYFDKMEGEFDHIKIRTRAYTSSLDHPEKMFLEAKVKMDKRQIKVRLPYNPQTGIEEAIANSGHPDWTFFQEFCGRKVLRPTCNVYYEREAFSLQSGTDKIRLNFDSNILYLHKDENTINSKLLETRQILNPEEILLEIKHSSTVMPPFLQQELHNLNSQVTSFSKYANSITLLKNLIQWDGD
jgi:hypothetical protein